MKKLTRLLVLLLSGCVRSSGSQPTVMEEDKTIIFPAFDTVLPIIVGDKGLPYELDGVTLRALMVAANDYIPPERRGENCWQRQEEQEYRVIRRGDIIFVEISADPQYCKGFMLLDDGLRYAISTDGRILRRLATGEPDGSPIPPSDGGTGFRGEPVPDELVGQLWGPTFIPPQWRRDGGSPSKAFDGGAPDGGTPDGG